MKTSIYVLLAMVLFIVACHRERTLNFIPGIYVNHAKGAYSQVDDTLVVRLLDGNNYEILRRTGFNRVVDGKQGKREYETEVWSGVYDSEKGLINESRYGKLLSFFPDSGLLRVGSRTYNKIK